MIKPLLTPIPVAGPFDRVGVDVISFPKSRYANSYEVVFVDYLTKWPQVFPVADQTALTIARLLVTKIIHSSARCAISTAFRSWKCLPLLTYV